MITSLRFVRAESKSSLLVILLFVSPSFGADARQIEITEPLEYKSSPINYFSNDTNDAIEKLKARIERREVSLKNRESSGYLLDLLAALDVSVASQTLVFSRSSLQEQLINPKNPRALYFNDDIAIGWIPGAPVIEITAQDPVKGAMFYTLPQPDQAVPAGKIVFHREERCLECHVSTATMNVPGYIVRSFQVDEFGEREVQSEYAEVTHAIPYKSRWGGWYVSGHTPNLVHAGNLFGEADANRHEQEPTFRGTLKDLGTLVDLTKYPSKHSDVVALMVLEHQMRFYDLVTRVNYEHRLGVRSDAEEQLAKYALMEDEAPLTVPVAGSTNYATWFQSSGCRDSRGRSLRDLNLTTRLFELRLSPLVRSRSFQGLPNDVKSRLRVRFQQARPDAIHFVPSTVAVQTVPSTPIHNFPIQPASRSSQRLRERRF